MKTYYLFWETDNCSGSTLIHATCEREAKDYFDFYFAQCGYILLSIERGGV